MSSLEPKIEPPAPGGSCPGATHEHGHALPILHEIRHALERLLASGRVRRASICTPCPSVRAIWNA
ncbi:MAG: hypothetical protein MZV65_27670 [Chromatiales bacterium]|nr:hypothetical protein [Chromatiales bacterium]